MTNASFAISCGQRGKRPIVYVHKLYKKKKHERVSYSTNRRRRYRMLYNTPLRTTTFITDIQFLSPLERRFGVGAFVCVFLEKTQSSTLTVLFLFFFQINRLRLRHCFCRSSCFSVLGRFASRFGGGVSRTRFCEGAPQPSRSIIRDDDVVAKVVGLVLVQRFDERERFHREPRGRAKRRSTCAGADLPPEEEELIKLEEGTLAAFCASVDIFVRSSGLLRCR